MTKRVLLVGGAGFIGHHMVEYYLENTDWELTVLDGLTYAGEANRLTDIENYDPDRVNILWHDLRAPIGEVLETRLRGMDYVINLASDSHVDQSIQRPVDFIHNNVMATLNLLEWARNQDSISAFVQISTDEVYGPAPNNYSHKEWDSIIPSNPYSASKASQEAIAISYWRTYGVPVIITNTMNNYGERQYREKFIPACIRSILTRSQMPVYAQMDRAYGYPVAGSRVWLHAKEHADAIMWILNGRPPSMYSDGCVRPDRYNIAGDEDINNLDLLLFISDILGMEAKFRFVDFHSSRPGHDMRYSLNNAKLDGLGWKQPYGIDSGLERTVRWYVDHKEWLGL